MNRDELRTRGPERPPAHRTSNGVTWIGPIDSDAGGTWIGTNEFGVTACLLNAYFPIGAAPEAIQSGAKSRGVIIPELLAHRSYRECATWLNESLDPTQFAGFMLLLVAADSCAHFLWRGHGELQHHAHDEEWTCLTSSFIDSTDAEKWRYSGFRSWVEQGAPSKSGLPLYHLQRDAGKESLSPLMDRDYSVTRSITSIDVDPAHTRVRYWSAPSPNTDPAHPTTELSLPLIAADTARPNCADAG